MSWSLRMVGWGCIAVVALLMLAMIWIAWGAKRKGSS